MFNTANFVAFLKKQCQDFKLECGGTWALGPNVFAAQIKESDNDEWVFVFYYDDTLVKIRDPRQVHRTLQLLLAGFQAGSLTGKKDDPIVFFHLAGQPLSECPVGNPENALNYATQLLLGIDDTEIQWLDGPEPVQFQ